MWSRSCCPSFRFLCDGLCVVSVGLINVLYVNKQKFSASSWRSNQDYTKMHGQLTINVWCRLCSYMVSVVCAAIWCESVVQLYGVSRLWSYMVSVGSAAIWCQSVVQLYGVSRLCSYMVSVVCAAIGCQSVVQLYGVSRLCNYRASVGCAAIWCQSFVQL